MTGVVLTIAAPKDNNRAWFIISMVVYMFKIINLSSTFVGWFKALLMEYPEVDTADMGFPHQLGERAAVEIGYIGD